MQYLPEIAPLPSTAALVSSVTDFLRAFPDLVAVPLIGEANAESRILPHELPAGDLGRKVPEACILVREPHNPYGEKSSPIGRRRCYVKVHVLASVDVDTRGYDARAQIDRLHALVAKALVGRTLSVPGALMAHPLGRATDAPAATYDDRYDALRSAATYLTDLDPAPAD